MVGIEDQAHVFYTLCFRLVIYIHMYEWLHIYLDDYISWFLAFGGKGQGMLFP